MSGSAAHLQDRAERFLAQPHLMITVDSDSHAQGQLFDLSRSGMALIVSQSSPTWRVGTEVDSLHIRTGTQIVASGPARIARASRLPPTATGDSDRWLVGLAFTQEQPELLARLATSLRPPTYVTGELAATPQPADDAPSRLPTRPDNHILAKCSNVRSWVDDMQRRGIYQRLYRVTLTGAIDHRVTAFDPMSRSERAMLCFDSNSYLGLHRHPRVMQEVERVLKQVGYGTPSAQLLCGTNRYLRELEDALSSFHGRQDTLVFPTGFAANTGTIQALVAAEDALVRDEHAHASIHEACRASKARFSKIFAHNNVQSLDTMLQRATANGCKGKLVATDGVFSMHGDIAPLPKLVDMCRAHGAQLMVDDAHGVGTLGARGRGIEEHYGMEGSVDVLMGTLSKSLGCLGGYVSGERDLIDHLRWSAPSGLFTTALPAALCAGITVALRIIEDEPQHREQLWCNIRAFAPALRDVGLLVSSGDSPIITVYVGAQKLMWDVSRELFDAGIKCGNVMYPAVGKSDSILRFTLNSRHTTAELDEAVDILTRVGKKYGLLARNREELRELGRDYTSRVAS